MLSLFIHVRLCDPMDRSPPGSSVRGIFQAILERVAMPSSRGSYLSRDQTCIYCVSCIGSGFFTTSTTWEAPQILVFPILCLKFVILSMSGSVLYFKDQVFSSLGMSLPCLPHQLRQSTSSGLCTLHECTGHTHSHMFLKFQQRAGQGTGKRGSLGIV